MTKLMRRIAASDDGFSMILVLGIGFVVMVFAMVAATGAVSILRSSGNHIVFAQSFDAAEAGVDQMLARAQYGHDNGFRYSYCPDPATGTGSCAQPAAYDSVAGWSSASAERSWAKATLSSLAALNNQALLTSAPQGTGGGQFLAIAPPWVDTVYSMSWVPNYAHAKRVRVIKSEYIFSTFHPTDAILTNGDIVGAGGNNCGSFNVGNAPGITTPVTIHTNGNDTSCVPGPSNGVQATVTASGNGPTAATSNTPLETIPSINPESIYHDSAAKYNWYDLCYNAGTGKPEYRSPNTAPNATPCTGTLLSTTNGYLGWSESLDRNNVPTWQYAGGDPGSTVFYVYRGNVNENNTGDITGKMTLITESTYNEDSTSCANNVDGNVYFKQVNWTSGSAMPGLMVLAGGNFFQDTQTQLGSGAFMAQGTVGMHTSASDYLQGLLVAQNLCGGTNNLQGSLLMYDGGDDIPLSTTIRTTLELELTNSN